MTERYTGEVFSIDRRGNATVRVADRLYIVPAAEARRAGIELASGMRVSFRLDDKAVLRRGIAPALAAEHA